jgi:hypothetical protein
MRASTVRALVQRGQVMRVASIMFALLFFTMVGTAQTPAKPAAAQAPARAAAAAPARYKPEAKNLAQIMRGILFPNSNIIFDAQNEDPTLKTKEINTKYGGVYGGWGAVENASLALSEAANLLMIPGRVCSNGKPVPLNRADWPKFVQGLRDAGQAAYKAALTKNMDNIVDAAGTVTEACSNCHDVYREKPNLSLRCTPNK